MGNIIDKIIFVESEHDIREIESPISKYVTNTLHDNILVKVHPLYRKPFVDIYGVLHIDVKLLKSVFLTISLFVNLLSKKFEIKKSKDLIIHMLSKGEKDGIAECPIN